jgi:hypothetical protein
MCQGPPARTSRGKWTPATRSDRCFLTRFPCSEFVSTDLAVPQHQNGTLQLSQERSPMDENGERSSVDARRLHDLARIGRPSSRTANSCRSARAWRG